MQEYIADLERLVRALDEVSTRMPYSTALQEDDRATIQLMATQIEAILTHVRPGESSRTHLARLYAADPSDNE